MAMTTLMVGFLGSGGVKGLATGDLRVIVVVVHGNIVRMSLLEVF